MYILLNNATTFPSRYIFTVLVKTAPFGQAPTACPMRISVKGTTAVNLKPRDKVPAAINNGGYDEVNGYSGVVIVGPTFNAPVICKSC